MALERVDRSAYAADIAACGVIYLEVGLLDRAEACFQVDDRVQPGVALAHRLMHLGKTRPDVALTQLQAAQKADPRNAYLMSAMARVLYQQQHQLAGAKVWVNQALAVRPEDKKATSLMWQICSDEKDWLCTIEYRKRLGLPTHFNVEQYQDVAKAWQDQAVKNGVGLAQKEPDFQTAPKRPG